MILGGASALPKPKPKPRPTPVLANSTVQYSTTGSNSAGTLSALSLNLFGGDTTEHLSLSMNDRTSAIAMPDTRDVGIFAFNEKASKWDARGTISSRHDELMQSLGDAVSISAAPLAAVSAVRYNRTYLNASCVDCDTTYAPACCADVLDTMDVLLQVYYMPAKKKRTPTLFFEWSLVTALAPYGLTVQGEQLRSVAVGSSAEGVFAAGISWNSSDNDQEEWAAGVLIFTPSSRGGADRSVARRQCIYVASRASCHY